MNLLAEKGKDRWGKKSPTIAFLGDSVTQGCFEVYVKNDGDIETVFDKNATYHGYLNQILTHLFPDTTVNIINAGISGDRAPLGAERLQRDVLDKNPDWMLLSCGVNDVGHGKNGVELEPYKKNISEIAEYLGFYDGMYFSKVFKKYYSVAPSEYRRLYGRQE